MGASISLAQGRDGYWFIAITLLIVIALAYTVMLLYVLARA